MTNLLKYEHIIYELTQTLCHRIEKKINQKFVWLKVASINIFRSTVSDCAPFLVVPVILFLNILAHFIHDLKNLLNEIRSFFKVNKSINDGYFHKSHSPQCQNTIMNLTNIVLCPSSTNLFQMKSL